MANTVSYISLQSICKLYYQLLFYFGQFEQEFVDVLCEHESINLIYIKKINDCAESLYYRVELEGVVNPKALTIHLNTSI